MCVGLAPSHLMLLHHALAHHLIHRGLREADRIQRSYHIAVPEKPFHPLEFFADVDGVRLFIRLSRNDVVHFSLISPLAICPLPLSRIVT